MLLCVTYPLTTTKKFKLKKNKQKTLHLWGPKLKPHPRSGVAGAETGTASSSPVAAGLINILKNKLNKSELSSVFQRKGGSGKRFTNELICIRAQPTDRQ